MHATDHSGEPAVPPALRSDRLPEAYRSILDALGDAFVVVDSDGVVVGFNAVAEQVFGYRADEIIGGPLGRLIPDGARAAHRALARAFTESATGHRTMGTERPMVRGKRKDGEEFRAEITISPLEVGGERMTGALVRDVSDRIAAQRALAEAEASGTRTPLRSLLPFAELLRFDSQVLPPSERDEMLQSIVNEAIDLTILIDDLVVAARLEHGAVQVAHVPVDLRAQALQVLEAWEQAEITHIFVQKETSRGVGDPARIRQILRHLVSEAMGRSNRVQIMFSEDHAYARVSVVDAGPELSEEEWDVADAAAVPTDANAVLGSGFGLSVSRRLADLMNGNLSYYRREYENVFELELPSAPEPGAPVRRFGLKTRVGPVDS